MAFWVSPLMLVAMASMKVASPMLAWIGTIAPRHPYVAFSQHKQTKNLSKEKWTMITALDEGAQYSREETEHKL